MTVFKKMYDEATADMEQAAKTRATAVAGIITEFLTEKGLVAEHPCKLVQGNKEFVGIFSIVSSHDSATLKFVPYKKDGLLSKNSRAFNFGDEPDFSWDVAGITSATLCEAPAMVTDGESVVSE